MEKHSDFRVTLDQLTNESKGGYIPFVEIIRTTGVDVGKVGSRKYKSWVIKQNSYKTLPQFSIFNSAYSEWSFVIHSWNGDVTTYRSYDDEKPILMQTDNTLLLSSVYDALGIDFPISDCHLDYLKTISNEFDGNLQQSSSVIIIEDGFVYHNNELMEVRSVNNDTGKTVLIKRNGAQITVPFLFAKI